jgi:hypothetical protein
MVYHNEHKEEVALSLHLRSPDEEGGHGCKGSLPTSMVEMHSMAGRKRRERMRERVRERVPRKIAPFGGS